MRKLAVVLGTVALAAVVVAAGFVLGAVWNQGRWTYSLADDGAGAYRTGYGTMGPGMMGYSTGTYGPYGAMAPGVTGPGMMYGSAGYGPYGMMMGYGPGAYGAGCAPGYGPYGGQEQEFERMREELRN